MGVCGRVAVCFRALKDRRAASRKRLASVGGKDSEATCSLLECFPAKSEVSVRPIRSTWAEAIVKMSIRSSV